MRLTKAQRVELRAKFGGRCSYCGDPLSDRWHADHLEAVMRGVGSYYSGQPMLHMDRDRIENLMPACAPCNISKASFTLEQWRGQLSRMLGVLARNNPTYRHALRFGMLEERPAPIVFYFERATHQPAVTTITRKDEA